MIACFWLYPLFCLRQQLIDFGYGALFFSLVVDILLGEMCLPLCIATKYKVILAMEHS